MKRQYLEEIFKEAQKNGEIIFNVQYKYGYENYISHLKEIKMCICWFLLTNIDLPYKYTIIRLAELYNTSTDQIQHYIDKHQELYQDLEQYHERYDQFIDSMYGVMYKLGMENERYIPGTKHEYHYLFDEMCGLLEDSGEKREIAETITFFKLFCLDQKSEMLNECKYNAKEHWLYYYAKYYSSVYIQSNNTNWIKSFTNHWNFYEASLKDYAGYRIDIIVNDSVNFSDDTLFN